MTIRQMIQENNRLRERMTPANNDYMEDVIVLVRSSRVNRQMAEKRLLEAASKVLEEQDKGRTAAQLFGDDPEAYGKAIVESLPKVKPVEGIMYYLMIPWVALTFLFLVEAVAGFVADWTGYQGGSLNRISLLALIILAVGSIILTEVVMKNLNHPKQEETAGKPQINLRAVGIYLIILVIVMIIGYSMRTMLPVFTVKPWVSLVIGLVGMAGLRLIFMRRS